MQTHRQMHGSVMVRGVLIGGDVHEVWDVRNEVIPRMVPAIPGRLVMNTTIRNRGDAASHYQSTHFPAR